MAVSTYFANNFSAVREQSLHEDLLIEAIRIHGMNVYYIPRTIVDRDEIYGEDNLSEYTSNYLIEMYVVNVEGYAGEGIFLSRFGQEIRDQVTLGLSIKRFRAETPFTRPKEGDLIWLAMNPERPQLMKILYVNDRSVFYQLGNITTYELTCEVFEYAGEKLDTGIPEIDAIQTNFSQDTNSSGLLTDEGKNIVDDNGAAVILGDFSLDDQMGDIFSNNSEFADEADTLIEWDATNPFSDGRY